MLQSSGRVRAVSEPWQAGQPVAYPGVGTFKPENVVRGTFSLLLTNSI